MDHMDYMFDICLHASTQSRAGLRHEIKTLDERTQILNADAEPENEFQQKAFKCT